MFGAVQRIEASFTAKTTKTLQFFLNISFALCLNTSLRPTDVGKVNICYALLYLDTSLLPFFPRMKQIYSVVNNITWLLLDGHSVRRAWKPEIPSRISAETEMELHNGEKCSQKNNADKEENGRDVSVNPHQPWCGATGGGLLNTSMSSNNR